MALYLHRKMHPAPNPSPSWGGESIIFVMLNLFQHLVNWAFYLYSGKLPEQVRDDSFAGGGDSIILFLPRVGEGRDGGLSWVTIISRVEKPHPAPNPSPSWGGESIEKLLVILFKPVGSNSAAARVFVRSRRE